LLKDLGRIDIFIHDGRYTYEQMKFEFEHRYPYLRRGAPFADDAMLNPAFTEFAASVSSLTSRLIRGAGCVKK